MELTSDDRQRIEQEVDLIYWHNKDSYTVKKMMHQVAEYATLYERQQQAQLQQENNEMMDTITKQDVRHGNDFAELSKLHKEFTEQAIKIDEKNVKIHQLEAERSELREKVIDEVIEKILTDEYFAHSTEELDFEIKRINDLLNSLKTK